MSTRRVVGPALALGAALGLARPASADWVVVLFDGNGPPAMLSREPTSAACRDYIDGLIRIANGHLEYARQMNDVSGIGDAQIAVTMLSRGAYCIYR